MPPVAVVRTYLEMDTPDRQTGRARIPPGFVLKRESCDPDLYRELYEGVGGDYHWNDRRAWSDDRLQAHLERPAITIWILREGPALRGFFELERHDDGSVTTPLDRLLPQVPLHRLFERAWARWAGGDRPGFVEPPGRRRA